MYARRSCFASKGRQLALDWRLNFFDVSVAPAERWKTAAFWDCCKCCRLGLILPNYTTSGIKPQRDFRPSRKGLVKNFVVTFDGEEQVKNDDDDDE